MPDLSSAVALNIKVNESSIGTLSIDETLGRLEIDGSSVSEVHTAAKSAEFTESKVHWIRKLQVENYMHFQNCHIDKIGRLGVYIERKAVSLIENCTIGSIEKEGIVAEGFLFMTDVKIQSLSNLSILSGFNDQATIVLNNVKVGNKAIKEVFKLHEMQKALNRARRSVDDGPGKSDFDMQSVSVAGMVDQTNIKTNADSNAPAESLEDQSLDSKGKSRNFEEGSHSSVNNFPGIKENLSTDGNSPDGSEVKELSEFRTAKDRSIGRKDSSIDRETALNLQVPETNIDKQSKDSADTFRDEENLSTVMDKSNTVEDGNDVVLKEIFVNRNFNPVLFSKIILSLKTLKAQENTHSNLDFSKVKMSVNIPLDDSLDREDKIGPNLIVDNVPLSRSDEFAEYFPNKKSFNLESISKKILGDLDPTLVLGMMSAFSEVEKSIKESNKPVDISKVSVKFSVPSKIQSIPPSNITESSKTLNLSTAEHDIKQSSTVSSQLEEVTTDFPDSAEELLTTVSAETFTVSSDLPEEQSSASTVMLDISTNTEPTTTVSNTLEYQVTDNPEYFSSDTLQTSNSESYTDTPATQPSSIEDLTYKAETEATTEIGHELQLQSTAKPESELNIGQSDHQGIAVTEAETTSATVSELDLVNTVSPDSNFVTENFSEKNLGSFETSTSEIQTTSSPLSENKFTYDPLEYDETATTPDSTITTSASLEMVTISENLVPDFHSPVNDSAVDPIVTLIPDTDILSLPTIESSTASEISENVTTSEENPSNEDQSLITHDLSPSLNSTTDVTLKRNSTYRKNYLAEFKKSMKEQILRLNNLAEQALRRKNTPPKEKVSEISENPNVRKTNKQQPVVFSTLQIIFLCLLGVSTLAFFIIMAYLCIKKCCFRCTDEYK